MASWARSSATPPPATMPSSKAARVVDAAQGRAVSEFGARHAHGIEAGVRAARAAYLAGCASTSNVEAGRRFDIPLSGTMAHSFVMAYEDEQQAFRDFYDVFPNSSTLLLDTYDTMRGLEAMLRAGLHPAATSPPEAPPSQEPAPPRALTARLTRSYRPDHWCCAVAPLRGPKRLREERHRRIPPTKAPSTSGLVFSERTAYALLALQPTRHCVPDLRQNFARRCAHILTNFGLHPGPR